MYKEVTNISKIKLCNEALQYVLERMDDELGNTIDEANNEIKALSIMRPFCHPDEHIINEDIMYYKCVIKIATEYRDTFRQAFGFLSNV